MKITKGKIPSAIKTIVYGVEGIGKSTFASKFPSPLYIDTEGSTKQLDVNRLPNPESWSELLEEVQYVIANPDVCKTLVIDTADWAEKLAIIKVCEQHKVEGLPDIPYGYGYIYLEQEFKNLLNLLDQVIKEGIHVVITSHAIIRTFSQPGGLDTYDRYELKLQKKTTPLLKEWSDLLLFANYKTRVIKDSKTGKAIGTGGDRVMYTSHTPSWDAKNRYDLPEELPFEFESIKHLFGEVKPQEEKPQEKKLDLFEKNEGIVESTPEDVKGLPLLLQNMKAYSVQDKEVLKWANDNGIKAEKLDDFEQDFIDYMNQNFGKLYSKIVDMRDPLGLTLGGK